MSNLYELYVASIAQADQYALIIFGLSLLFVAAWYSITFLPPRWQIHARLLAWLYAVTALVVTVVISKGISR